jgi:hypothetical protein
MAGPGAESAAQHLQFARQLATAHRRLAPSDFGPIATMVDDNDCQVPIGKTEWSAEDLSLAKAYATKVCQSWNSLWERMSESEVCEEQNERCLEHLDLDGFFSAMAAGIASSRTELERQNIIDMVVAALSVGNCGEFGDKPADRWATAAAEAYLPKASFDETVEFVKGIQATPNGLTPNVKNRLRDYARKSNLTPKQRASMQSLLSKRFTDD